MESVNWFNGIEIINEVNKKGIYSHIIHMYSHMIKYKYCNEWQDSTWHRTIENGSNFISKTKKDNKNFVYTVDLESLFVDGKLEAIKETGKKHQTIALEDIPEHPIDGDLDWFNIDDLANIDKVEKWIKDNFDPTRQIGYK